MTDPVELRSRMTSDVFGDWLKDLFQENNIQANVVIGRIIDMPSQAVSVLSEPGGDKTNEGLFELSQYHLRVRGRPNSEKSAEDLAMAIDSAIFEAESFEIEDITVLQVTAIGGSPQQMPINDSENCFNFTAEYEVWSSTGV